MARWTVLGNVLGTHTGTSVTEVDQLRSVGNADLQRDVRMHQAHREDSCRVEFGDRLDIR